MSVKHIDAGILKKMFISGAYNLEANKELIDELNVFPVPDGDTGTNMTMTILSAVNEINSIKDDDMEGLLKAIAKGSLRGARGNSGVILSQLIRGFTREIQEHKKPVDRKILTLAIEKAVDTAYKAVMKPKEGTILTVAKGIAKKAVILYKEGLDLQKMMEALLDEGDHVLNLTPEMLPVLKEAGVVDSGGKGLMVLLHGAYSAFIGKEVKRSVKEPSEESKATSAAAAVNRPIEAPEFGYCTEFIINIEKEPSKKELTEMSAFLESMGDSVVLVCDSGLIKIHVHTNNPGTVLQRALTFGELTNIKIDNMREEHRAMLGLSDEQPPKEEKIPPKPYGFITVCAGEGFKQIFDDMGVDVVISGGQTMNPSTDDFMTAISVINAETIFIFPNNSNILMAANQARVLTEDKNIIVIPTKAVTQGISAMISFDGAMSPEENAEAMKEAAAAVSTAQITYAVRDTTIDGINIKTNDIMAVGDKKILNVGEDITEVALESAKTIADDTKELICIYYGEEYSEEEAEKLAEMIDEQIPSCDVEVSYGGQPVYYCLISAE